MRGSIRKRTLADGSRRYDCRYRAAGRQRTKSFDRRRDADRFLAKQMQAVHDGSYVETTPKLMKDVFAAWLEEVDVRVRMEELKASTAANYRGSVEVHFGPAFGELRSDHLTAAAVKRWRRSCADRIAAGTMGKATFNGLFNQLHAILSWARAPAQSYLAHDPLIGQKRLKIKRSEANFLEHKQINTLLEAVAGSPEENAIIHIALFAGLRRGELFALSWSDVEWGDGAGGCLRIRRSVYRGVVTTPKTEAAERTVDVPRRVLNVLAALRATRQLAARGLIFPRKTTEFPIDAGSWCRRRLTKIYKRAGLPETTGLHSLRHTYASLLIDQGENPKYISAQLGHSSTSFTMDVYGHLFRKTSNAAMERLNEMIPEPARLRVVGGRDA